MGYGMKEQEFVATSIETGRAYLVTVNEYEMGYLAKELAEVRVKFLMAGATVERIIWPDQYTWRKVAA